MQLPEQRPRFELVTDLPAAVLAERVLKLVRCSSRLRGWADAERIELSIDGDEHTFWSPQLTAALRPEPGGGTRVSARLGPDPYVWALYALAYLGVGFVAIAALVFGVAQAALAQPPTGLYVGAVAAFVAMLIYGASYVGQGLGSDQMYFLRSTLEELAGDGRPRG
jgi:hypothetical protein